MAKQIKPLTPSQVQLWACVSDSRLICFITSVEMVENWLFKATDDIRYRT